MPADDGRLMAKWRLIEITFFPLILSVDYFFLSAGPDDVYDYCNRLFEFQTITIKKYRTWKDRRMHQKKLKGQPSLVCTVHVPHLINNMF